MFGLFCFVLAILNSPFKSKSRLEAENAVLRNQLIVLQRKVRRECVDHFIVLGEAHLRRLLRAYASYYNEIRTHRSLDKDVPVSRPVQRTGIISSCPILGDLHHHYVPV